MFLSKACVNVTQCNGSVCRIYLKICRPHRKTDLTLSVGVRQADWRNKSNTPLLTHPHSPTHTVSTATMVTLTWGLLGKTITIFSSARHRVYGFKHTKMCTYTYNTRRHTLIQWLCKHNSWLTFPLFWTFCSRRPFWPLVPLNCTGQTGTQHTAQRKSVTCCWFNDLFWSHKHIKHRWNCSLFRFESAMSFTYDLWGSVLTSYCTALWQ